MPSLTFTAGARGGQRNEEGGMCVAGDECVWVPISLCVCVCVCVCEEAESHLGDAPGGGGGETPRAKPPAPNNPQTNPRLTPRLSLTPTNPLTALTPQPQPQRCGTPARGPVKYEGMSTDSMGQDGHGQNT